MYRTANRAHRRISPDNMLGVSMGPWEWVLSMAHMKHSPGLVLDACILSWVGIPTIHGDKHLEVIKLE
jgi:hypothetical protein